MENTKKCLKDNVCCIWILFGIGLLLTVILVPLSYSRVEYYEIALVRDKITGVVNTETTYYSGLHSIGPSFEFLKFPSTQETLFLKDVSVFSLSDGNSGGTTVYIDLAIQYRIDDENLGLLYKKTGLNYKNLVRDISTTSIKDTAARFSADDYLLRREFIEKSFRGDVEIKLNNIYMTLTGFQLRKIRFSAQFEDKKLKAAIQRLLVKQREFEQESKIIRSKTGEEVKRIKNDADSIVKFANAQSTGIVEEAKNNATEIVGSAEKEGLLFVHDALSLDVLSAPDRQILKKLARILGLKKNGKAEYLVNFDQAPVVV